MAYVKNTWVTGDTITASKLNHIETGIEESGAGAFVVHATADVDYALKEITNLVVTESISSILNAIESEQNVIMLLSLSNGSDVYCLRVDNYLYDENNNLDEISFASITTAYQNTDTTVVIFQINVRYASESWDAEYRETLVSRSD